MQMSIYSKKVFLVFCILFFVPEFSVRADAPDPVRRKNGMVVSASNLASKVGLQVLKKGGNAVDAAVAVGFALAVTYPSAGNIGGGGFMVIHLKDGKNITIDYREKAPINAASEMYFDEKGSVDTNKIQEGVLSSGVPGSVAGLIYALEKYGTLKLADVIQPAINLAEIGFPLEYRLAQSFKSYLDYFKKYESSLKIFSKNGLPYLEGEIFKQPDLAFTLKQIKEKGRDSFYKGKVAELIVQQSKKLGGIITLEDLENYQAVERQAITGSYKEFEVVSMGPPSAGGIGLIQLLNVLENLNFSKAEWGSSKYIHVLVEAMKYVYADRSVHLGDEDFYPVPKGWLLSKRYSKEIFGKISDEAIASEKVFAGNPKLYKESEETTHYSVYDGQGNAVSTTTTINSGYGSKVVVDGAGFLLNNEMDDFSVQPGFANQFGLIGSKANSIEPGKRMLSSMTPTIILKDGFPYLIAGSPGGSTILTVVLQVILNCINFKMDIQEAINQPRFHHQWLPDQIDYEEFGMAVDVIDNLVKRGHKIGQIKSLGRVEGILIDIENNIIFGATDPRGFGSAEGY
ncbi:MAG: gamma-glutamyltransferase [Ignavibacteria bacterium RIFOXYB2_FULL_35_12]|nr:MAG: gamma-glutamyltransferase [Ignavibacteria bacterium GWF2_35_20]OGU90481.1 MAG: gamma-glutamyltransferase [Ignavibacteria bacterium RIFOXYC12_FULL_35_11]OGU91902.1 MAG: gamma-glutamyltransferase [Ignavibacteria bacterium RIFOXYA12_FULL_35_25]OGU95087.1 MAG: gamma-glutamyltransferase [Ignavibacteria bacterium RIFOXYB12_FULL_35_14]OGV01803.1 MAG: gamma-glutamyltransferase [Ignavibacteria bacterium RIFOXYC2_FULL_35_16]OGV05091.1 MAG: gamma-glutamyltransferase [Ignavibacteria bacterium RIFO